ncbi:MAG TPA: glycosyltransferase family 4 protein, partial [Acidobacteriota bacterium]|nr:glycosyltransferase family 4 protein [Acidobacteriota bacterium]
AHGYHALPALYAANSKRKNKLFFTAHYHGTGHTPLRRLLNRPYRLVGKKIFEKADRIICVSKHERALILRDFKVNETKAIVIPNGFNLTEYRGLRKEKKDFRTILCVGRLEEYKGAQYLIEALPKMDNDILLEIVGKGPYRETLVRLAKRLDVSNRVRFSQDLPRRSLLQKYVDADLFVLLSTHEAYGISVGEALCAGTPCLVANASALTEWIDGANCFGIDYPINLDQLQGSMMDIIEKPRILNPPRLLDWSEVAEKLAAIYEGC